MARTARASTGGVCYHVLNRGNARAEVFHKDGDYAAFVQLLIDVHDYVAMRVLSYCLMPNHFHLVLWPREDGDLSRAMQWLTTSHVRRYHAHYGGSGHVWQGRFKAFPIQQDEHLLAVLRYVERNPLRANLVKEADRWRWSSLTCRHVEPWLAPWPIARPRDWRRRVQKPQNPVEEAALRHSVVRSTPYGDDRWTRRTAARLGLESTLRPRGRPRKRQQK